MFLYQWESTELNQIMCSAPCCRYLVAEGVLPAVDIWYQRECSLLYIFGTRGSAPCWRYLVAEEVKAVQYYCEG